MRPGKVSEVRLETVAPPDKHAGCWWRASRDHTHGTEFAQLEEFEGLCTGAAATNCIGVSHVHCWKGLSRLDCTRCTQELDHS